MDIEEGKFYFIKDKFFKLFNDYNLMKNKENGNKRPCYFCFRDNDYPHIIWFVPISSKIDKYTKIYETKKKKRRKVLNFVFGEVLGKKKVFLIQNMFPTTKDYIIEKYKNNGADVEVSRKLKFKVISTANDVIAMAKTGLCIPFYDIIEMRNKLLENSKVTN